MQVQGAPRGGGRGGRGRGRGNGNGYNTAGSNFGVPQPYGGVYPPQPPVYNTGAYPPQPGFVQPGYDNFGGAGRGAGGVKKPPKMASHVQFDQTMVLNVAMGLTQGEHPAALSSFALSCLPPLSPGQPPRVSVYTGDVNGIMREFAFGAAWVPGRKAQHEGMVTALLAVDAFLFVGIHQLLPTNQPIGLIKAYNLADNSQFMLQDPRMLPAAHGIGVKCIVQAGQFLISGGADGQVKAWSFVNNSWTLHGMYGGESGAHAAEVTAISGKCAGSLITASGRGDLRVWRVGDGSIISQNQQGHIGPIAALDVLAIGPEHQYVITCGESDGFVRMWAAPTLNPLHQVSVQPPLAPGVQARPHVPITALKVIQVGGMHQLFIGFRNGNVLVYLMRDTTNFEKLGFVDGHQRQTKVLGFDLIATGASPMMCMVTDKGFVNWFRFAIA